MFHHSSLVAPFGDVVFELLSTHRINSMHFAVVRTELHRRREFLSTINLIVCLMLIGPKPNELALLF